MPSSSHLRRALALLALPALAACVPPLQNGGVDVLPGAAERLSVACRFRLSDASSADMCGPAQEEEEAPPPSPPPEPSVAIGIHVDVIELTGPPHPSPAKVQVFAAAGPGEPRGKRLGEPVLAAAGQADLPLAPGRYTVVVSRGPEFTLGAETVEVSEGAVTPVVLGVRRVVDTRGFVPCDLQGVRTGEEGPDVGAAAASAAAADSARSEAERVAANVALGGSCSVLTNGPFVTLRADGVPQGGLVALGSAPSAPSAPTELHLHIDRAPWVDASEMVLWVGGVRSEPIPLPVDRPGWTGSIVTDLSIHLVRSFPAAKPGSSVKFLLNRGAGGWTLSLPEDTFVVAVVSGRRPLEPVISGDGEAMPFGMSAPVWIDADGDGRGLTHR